MSTFKPSQLDIEDLPPLSDDERRTWLVAEAEYDSTQLIIRYNESGRDWIGHAELPIKLGFAIPLNSPNEGGLPDPEENEQLNAIEDIIVREVESRTRGIQAMVLTTGHMKEFVFYVPEGSDIKSIHESVQAAVDTHEVQCMGIFEPEWNAYVEFDPA